LPFSSVRDRALAQTPSYEVHPDFLVKHFTVEDGLPINNITGLTQTDDGYLWMTTADGLVRFDGLNFAVFNTSNSPGLPGNRLHSLRKDHDGVLRMQAEAGQVLRFHEGRFSQTEDTTNHFVEGDTLWLSTLDGLAYEVEGLSYPFHPDIIQGKIHALLRTRQGDLWLGGDHGIYHVPRKGVVVHYAEEEGIRSSDALYEDLKGNLWAGIEDSDGRYRLRVFRGGRFEAVPGIPESFFNYGIYHNDPDFWMLCFVDCSTKNRGWRVYRDEALKLAPAIEPMRGYNPALIHGPEGETWWIQGLWLYRDDVPILRLDKNFPGLFFDSENSLWVWSEGGLYRIQRRLLRTVSEEAGLPGRNVYPILEDHRGAIWLGLWNRKGLVHMTPDSVTTLNLGTVASLYEDRAGVLWVGRLFELCRIDGARCVPSDLTNINTIRAIYEDRQQRFWVGMQNGLVLGRSTEEGRSWTHFTTETGLTNNWVRVIVETRDGEVLFGTNGGGILRYRDDETFEAFTTADGLASNLIRDLYEDRDGFL